MKHPLAYTKSQISGCASSVVLWVGFLICPQELPIRKESLCSFSWLGDIVQSGKKSIYLVSIKVFITPNFKFF